MMATPLVPYLRVYGIAPVEERKYISSVLLFLRCTPFAPVMAAQWAGKMKNRVGNWLC
jgi:hypothetical protein